LQFQDDTGTVAVIWHLGKEKTGEKCPDLEGLVEVISAVLIELRNV
jgi:hypothetical protein